jgi:ribonuclease Z
MRAIPLGISSGVPTASRNVSAVAVEVVPGRNWILLDCGEGTQQRVARTALALSSLEAVYVTHLHGDHVLGLPGLLSTLGLRQRAPALDVFGPRGIRELLESCLRVTDVRLTFRLSVREIDDADVDAGPAHARRWLHRSPRHGVRVGRLDHRVPAYGYRVEDAWGRSLVYCTDTRPCAGTVELARDAGLLIHEATYAHELARLASERGHSTALEAAEMARRAGARSLLITHFSPRYPDPRPLVVEARRIFPRTWAARELIPFTLKAPPTATGQRAA